MMNKQVFVVTYVGWMETYVVGVFETEEKAKRYVDDKFGGNDRYQVEGWEVR